MSKFLGIYAGITNLESNNWAALTDIIPEQRIANIHGNLTIKGRTVIMNETILSRMRYKASILGIPSRYSAFQALINSFVWKNTLHLN